MAGPLVKDFIVTSPIDLMSRPGAPLQPGSRYQMAFMEIVNKFTGEVTYQSPELIDHTGQTRVPLSDDELQTLLDSDDVIVV
jgi:hypothetical protein